MLFRCAVEGATVGTEPAGEEEAANSERKHLDALLLERWCLVLSSEYAVDVHGTSIPRLAQSISPAMILASCSRSTSMVVSDGIG